MSTEQEIDVVPDWGPKMRALNERQRAFVVALFDEDCPEKHEGQNLYAAHKAGYGNADGSSSNKALGVIGARLRSDRRVQQAIAELFGAVIHNLAPDAARELRFKLRNRKGRDQIKAIAAIADRVAPIETTTTLKIQDNRPPSIEATQRVIERIDALTRRAGLLPAQPSPVIDGEFSVVKSGADS